MTVVADRHTDTDTALRTWTRACRLDTRAAVGDMGSRGRAAMMSRAITGDRRGEPTSASLLKAGVLSGRRTLPPRRDASAADLRRQDGRWSRRPRPGGDAGRHGDAAAAAGAPRKGGVEQRTARSATTRPRHARGGNRDGPTALSAGRAQHHPDR